MAKTLLSVQVVDKIDSFDHALYIQMNLLTLELPFPLNLMTPKYLSKQKISLKLEAIVKYLTQLEFYKEIPMWNLLQYKKQ